MTREIAVFHGSDGLTLPLGEPGTVTVYRRREGRWDIARQTAWELDAGRGMKELRRQMAGLLEFLGSCKVFVARSVTGLPYYEMEKAGISIWEVSGQPREFLTDIALRDEEAREESAAPAMMVVTPTQLSPGHFFLSIKEIQEKECGVTSKQVLVPLLRKKDFSILEIRCNHAPPWLEAEIAACGLVSRVEKLGGNEYKVVVATDAATL